MTATRTWMICRRRALHQLHLLREKGARGTTAIQIWTVCHERSEARDERRLRGTTPILTWTRFHGRRRGERLRKLQRGTTRTVTWTIYPGGKQLLLTARRRRWIRDESELLPKLRSEQPRERRWRARGTTPTATWMIYQERTEVLRREGRRRARGTTPIRPTWTTCRGRPVRLRSEAPRRCRPRTRTTRRQGRRRATALTR